MKSIKIGSENKVDKNNLSDESLMKVLVALVAVVIKLISCNLILKKCLVYKCIYAIYGH